MKIEVISLGGSVMVPDRVDVAFLNTFKQTLSTFKDRRFVIIVGGGKTARNYIEPLLKSRVNQKDIALIAMAAINLHATFLARFLGPLASQTMPTSLKHLKQLLKKHRVVCVGALHYHKHNTSDGTSAEIARHLRTRFINITNIKGLYDKNPVTSRTATFIPCITYAAFSTMINKIPFKLGQHYVLDQRAAKIIQQAKIPTYIIGKSLKNLEHLLQGKKYVGTIIQ